MLQVSGLIDPILVDSIRGADRPCRGRRVPGADPAGELARHRASTTTSSKTCSTTSQNAAGPDRDLGRPERRTLLRTRRADAHRRRHHRHGPGRTRRLCRLAAVHLVRPRSGFDGAAQDALRNGSLGLNEARALAVFTEIQDVGVPTITSMVEVLDGREVDGRTLETTEEAITDSGQVRRDTTSTVRFAKLSAGRPAVPHGRQPTGRLPAAARPVSR